MKEKGFTLIELLAVIVILAIIALIATPIILNIINDSKVESKKRSAENYFDAVELAVANKNLEGKFNPSKCTISDETKKLICEGEFDAVHCPGQNECIAPELNVKVDGEVPTSVNIIFSNGSVANGTTITIGNTSFVKENDGLKLPTDESESEQLEKYYYYGYGYLKEPLPDTASKNVSEINTKGNPFYIRLEVDNNNIVTTAYVCFQKSGKEYCLKGADTDSYEVNKTILNQSFGSIENACALSEDETSFKCYDGVVDVAATSHGMVSVSGRLESCAIRGGNQFLCGQE